MALLDRVLAGIAWRERLVRGFLAGLVLYVVTFFWMRDFTWPGYVLAAVVSAGFLGAAAVATGGRRWALPAALTLLEGLRLVFPFGGVPLSNLALGQAGGPLAPAARVGTYLLVVLLLGLAGVAVSALLARTWRAGLAAVAVVVVTVAVSNAAPDGRATGTLRVALVQGGGRLGTRAIDTDERVVFERHLRASQRVDRPVDLVLWPEDVVDVEGPVDESREGAELGELAADLDTTLVAGVVEGVGDRFRNSVVAWTPDGEIVDRYEKVRRVPFGEYIPFRSLVDPVADLSLIEREALVGSGPGFLSTPAGDLAAVISYELFFVDRARSGVEAGGELLLAPTNASSYRLGLVAGQEVAASRLRALETGRWTLQVAPTGFSAVIDEDGRVLARTGQRERAVLQMAVERRQGQTVATRVGRLPVLGAAGAMLVAALRPRGGWSRARR